VYFLQGTDTITRDDGTRSLNCRPSMPANSGPSSTVTVFPVVYPLLSFGASAAWAKLVANPTMNVEVRST